MSLSQENSRSNAPAGVLFLVLLACSALGPAHAGVFPASAAAPDQARQCLLRMFNQTTTRDRKVFSQHGEDGIIETIFECIGTTNLQYVEFGVQDGKECTSRNLRENHNFTGLMMDGGFYIAELNLQKEFIYSYNIVQLFQKYKVPHPSFDHLTVDLDQNSFGVALAVLRGGYRPRSLTVEFNRNFAWSDPGYAVLDLPDETWLYPDACEAGCSTPSYPGDCYYSASARAWFNMVRSFGYHFVAADTIGVNLFFVHESAAGVEPLLTLDDAKRLATKGSDYPMLHTACSRHPWLFLPEVDFADASFELNDMPIVLLSTKPKGASNQQRSFSVTNMTAGLKDKLASQPYKPYGPSDTAVPRITPGVNFSTAGTAFACGASLEAGTVVAMVLVSFVGGALLHRSANSMLLMVLGRPTTLQSKV